MKSIGVMTYKQLQQLANEIKASAPAEAKVDIRETASTLVVNSDKGVLLRAVWRIKRECAVQAVEGLIIKE